MDHSIHSGNGRLAS